MKPKKAIFLLFVLIANILLAVHGILPHQHYAGFAWFPTDHREKHSHTIEYLTVESGHQHRDSEHQHHNHAQNHKDQEHNHNQSCLLAQVYIVPGNSPRLECPLTDYWNQSLDFQIVFIHPDAAENIPVFLRIPLPPLIQEEDKPSCLIFSSGLRAPPVC